MRPPELLGGSRLAGGAPGVSWDPFAFHTAYATGDGGTCCFGPAGVVDEGQVLPPAVDTGAVTPSGHDGSTWLSDVDSVHSYARFATDGPGQGEVWVQELAVTDATCTLTNTGPGNSGKGEDISRVELTVALSGTTRTRMRAQAGSWTPVGSLPNPARARR